MEGRKKVNEAGNRSWAGEQGSRGGRRSLAKLWVAVGITVAMVATAWLAYSHRQSDAAASTAPAALPQVVVSKPLEREVDSRLGFLGQFSAVEQVELRAQVGGTMAGLSDTITSGPRSPTRMGWSFGAGPPSAAAGMPNSRNSYRSVRGYAIVAALAPRAWRGQYEHPD